MLFKRGKKAQAGKVFMYALTLIVVAMILLFGYKSIAKVIKTSEKATMAKFKNDLVNKIDTASSYGRISTEDFETPVNYKFICFVVDDTENFQFESDYPVAIDIAASEDNVFLYDGQTIDPFKVDLFEIEEGDEYGYGSGPPDALCIPIQNGRFSIRLEGLGDRTLISS